MRITPEIVEPAEMMLANGQDWSPEADEILSTDNSLCLCSYPDGAWIVDTHDEVNMDRWTDWNALSRSHVEKVGKDPREQKEKPDDWLDAALDRGYVHRGHHRLMVFTSMVCQ